MILITTKFSTKKKLVLSRKKKCVKSTTLTSTSKSSFHIFLFVCLFVPNRNFPADSPVVHILSASCAGFAASTATNPIWFVKTRLQLDHNSKTKMTVRECIRRIYKTSGILGFYKGISASYVGISETVIHFVIYEALKAKLVSAETRFKLCESIIFVSFFLLCFRLSCDRAIRVRVKHHVILWNLCWPALYQKRLHRAWHIRMRWPEPD